MCRIILLAIFLKKYEFKQMKFFPHEGGKIFSFLVLNIYYIYQIYIISSNVSIFENLEKLKVTPPHSVPLCLMSLIESMTVYCIACFCTVQYLVTSPF